MPAAMRGTAPAVRAGDVRSGGTRSAVWSSLAGEIMLPSDGWMMVVSEGLRHADLERLIAERGGQLMRAAIALTGARESAEDLLQAAFERLLRNSRRVCDPEDYLRRVLYNLAADGWRRRGRWRRVLPALAAGQHPSADPADAVALRAAVAGLLAQLPPRQRAVLLLRYWEQLSEAETAAVLGCAEGTVKSAASRGLARLRELTRSWPEAGTPQRPLRSAIREGNHDA